MEYDGDSKSYPLRQSKIYILAFLKSLLNKQAIVVLVFYEWSPRTLNLSIDQDSSLVIISVHYDYLSTRTRSNSVLDKIDCYEVNVQKRSHLIIQKDICK